MKNKFFIFLCALPLSISYLFVFPQISAAIDSGSLLNEQQQLQQTPQSLPTTLVTMEPELQIDKGVKVFVKQFQFQGYENLISLKELEKITNQYLNTDQDFAGLQKITRVLTGYLREEKGFLLSRAYLPQQDVTDGLIKIAIIPGQLEGKVNVEMEGNHRIKTSLLEKIAQRSILKNETILLNDVERAVLLINDLPGVSARAYLDKGEAPGTSRITLKTKEGPWLAGAIFADNFGNRYTGSFRRTAQVAASDYFGKGEYFSLAYVNANDLDQGRVNVSLPIGDRGLSLDMAYSGMRYELGGKLKDLKSDGTAHTISLKTRFPLKRTRKASMWLGTGCEFIFLEDKLNSGVTSDRNVGSGEIILSGNFYDQFFKGGLTSFSLAAIHGNVNITDGLATDLAGANTDGHFLRSNYSIARLQRVTKQVSLFMSVRGQVADGNLDSSKKIILGGPAGVRAYPVSESSGDEGHIFTLENRVELPTILKDIKSQLIMFVDAGFVRLHKDTWANSVTNISGRNHYWLCGFGPGINIEKNGVFRLQFSYARKIGNNPGRDTADNDADNRSDKGRFWVQLSIQF